MHKYYFGLHYNVYSIVNIYVMIFLSLVCCHIVVRYDPITDSYHDDMEGNGVICLAVDTLPTEFAKEVGAFSFAISFTSIGLENATGLEND